MYLKISQSLPTPEKLLNPFPLKIKIVARTKMSNDKNNVEIRYILSHNFHDEIIQVLTFLKDNPRTRALYHIKESLKKINEYKSRYESFFGSVEDMSSTAWTNNIVSVSIIYSSDGKGRHKITFKNGESISVTYDELHSQSKMVKKFFRKFMVTPPKIIPSEYEKVENFVILEARRDKVAGELDNVTQPQRPSKEQKQSKYNNRGESTPYYNRKEIKICFLSNIHVALGGMR